MIPKKIHYCWFGRGEKPSSVIKCIESWKKYCPDYQIVEWNEDNYDITGNQYMYDAYVNKKWGFVPDYARLDIIYNEGGIYLDTDVQVIASFDGLLEYEAFIGFENSGTPDLYVNCGQGFGAVPGNPDIKHLRDTYKSLRFINDDNSLNQTASPIYTTDSLVKLGLKLDNRLQQVSTLHILPSEVLCPKNYLTGKISRTANTIAIHHFDGSWIDEDILYHIKHDTRIRRIFGYKMGNIYLYLESVLFKLIEISRSKTYKTKEYIRVLKYYLSKKRYPVYKNEFVFLDTSISSDNIGDQIIVSSCERELSCFIDIQNINRIPTHVLPSSGESHLLSNARYKILLGTNILFSTFGTRGLLRYGEDLCNYEGMLLMGVGFGNVKNKPDLYAKLLFKKWLTSNYIHSVRDKRSVKILNEMGIKNVLYTACPTMWGLTPSILSEIPQSKSKKVVFTLTDYNRDYNLDSIFIDILRDSYEEIYFWPQGDQDLLYINELLNTKEININILDRTLNSYEYCLSSNNIDYIGTRLHAGIFALSKSVRSIIISIDDRAREISNDTHLLTLERTDIPYKLSYLIESNLTFQLELPLANIKKWKAQFN